MVPLHHEILSTGESGWFHGRVHYPQFPFWLRSVREAIKFGQRYETELFMNMIIFKHLSVRYATCRNLVGQLIVG
jgi:hypothetical protein